MTAVPSLFDDEQPTEPNHPGGAPPLDWWVIATTKDEAYRRVLAAMCPERVCRQCGEPSRRIVDNVRYVRADGSVLTEPEQWESGIIKGLGAHTTKPGGMTKTRVNDTVGFSDCSHDDWRPGVWLDPFNPEAT